VDGVTYAWQVKGKLLSSRGVQVLPSQVYRFIYETAGANNGTIAKINITPIEIEVAAGQQYQFKAELLDKDNKPVTTVKPIWQVSPNKGTITQNGLFTAGGESTTVAVLAKAGTISDFSTVSVKAKNVMPISDERWIEQLIRGVFGLPSKTQ